MLPYVLNRSIPLLATHTHIHALTLAAKVRTTKGWATAGRSAERALVLVAARTAVRDAMRAAAENIIAKVDRRRTQLRDARRGSVQSKERAVRQHMINQNNPERD